MFSKAFAAIASKCVCMWKRVNIRYICISSLSLDTRYKLPRRQLATFPCRSLQKNIGHSTQKTFRIQSQSRPIRIFNVCHLIIEVSWQEFTTSDKLEPSNQVIQQLPSSHRIYLGRNITTSEEPEPSNQDIQCLPSNHNKYLGSFLRKYVYFRQYICCSISHYRFLCLTILCVFIRNVDFTFCLCLF